MPKFIRAVVYIRTPEQLENYRKLQSELALKNRSYSDWVNKKIKNHVGKKSKVWSEKNRVQRG